MRLRPLLLGLVAFDVVLGGGCVLAPTLFAAVCWPTADPGALVLLRRTGWIWLAFALAQFLAWRSPTPEALRRVAFLRLMDIPADLTWLSGASGLTALGWLGIGTAPPINLAVGLTLWRLASRREPIGGSPPTQTETG